jgi:hypothetical protein
MNLPQELINILAALAMSGTRIVFDEAQFGLYMRHNGRSGAGIDYLRDLCERGNTFAVLICHESEVPGFSELDHVRTRIGHRISMFNATLADTTHFVRSLCEVEQIQQASPGAIVNRAMKPSRRDWSNPSSGASSWAAARRAAECRERSASGHISLPDSGSGSASESDSEGLMGSDGLRRRLSDADGC